MLKRECRTSGNWGTDLRGGNLDWNSYRLTISDSIASGDQDNYSCASFQESVDEFTFNGGVESFHCLLLSGRCENDSFKMIIR
jgi:hypothetical protein